MRQRVGHAVACAAMATVACGGAEEAQFPATSAGGASAASGSGGLSATSGTGASTSSGTGAGGRPDIPCPSGGPVPGEHQRTIDFDGSERVYELQIPIRYDGTTRVPLVFDIHGFTSNKDQQQLVSGFAGKAEDEGFLVVRPEGVGLAPSWNAGDNCCGDALAQELDDVGLMRAIAEELVAEACIDERRIYATGISNGGALSHRIACEAADLFAAVAPVAYPLDFEPFTPCQPSRPIPVMHLHGDDDLIVPYDGSGIGPPTPDSFAYWADTNGCSGDPVPTYENDDSLCETHQDCAAGVEVTLCTVDGGHVLYVNNDAVPITDLAWGFLSRFELP
jgi:polyhydroxybutyrate depolymerase